MRLPLKKSSLQRNGEPNSMLGWTDQAQGTDVTLEDKRTHVEDFKN